MILLRIIECVLCGVLTLFLLAGIPVAADNTAASVLEKADTATHNAASYRMTMTTIDKRGTHLTTLEYVRPDHYHLVLDARHTEMIVIGKTTYMKARGQWHKFPVDMNDSIAQIRPEMTKEMLQKATIKQVGTEVVNGVPTTIYEVTSDAFSSHSVKKYWISDKDNLLCKIAGTSDLSDIQGLGRKGGGKSTYSAVIDYKASVKIETPRE